MTEKIDFVIAWVDGNDEKWQEEKAFYRNHGRKGDRISNFRDWDNLHYLFRGIEKFAPWVNQIHFVTWGHVPSWLNLHHPKLNIVKHTDYIPEAYLPTFSARPIEINLHRIKGLSEQFVYFNDDMFLLRDVKEEDFFKNGQPCDLGVFDIIGFEDDLHGSAEFNSIHLINHYFTKKQTVQKHLSKWLNLTYGKYLIRSILLLPWGRFTGFYNSHLPNAYVKSTYEEVWEKEGDLLHATSANKFRTKQDVTQNIFRHWQLASGNFAPRGILGHVYTIGFNHAQAYQVIQKQKDKMICLNDSENISEFERRKTEIKSSFNQILPHPSTFERADEGR